jgi:hypothetical protein
MLDPDSLLGYMSENSSMRRRRKVAPRKEGTSKGPWTSE